MTSIALLRKTLQYDLITFTLVKHNYDLQLRFKFGHFLHLLLQVLQSHDEEQNAFKGQYGLPY